MKLLFLTLITVFITSVCSYSQNISDAADGMKLNNVYSTILGNASVISFNYERVLPVKPKLRIAVKSGIGYNWIYSIGLFGSEGSWESLITLPHHLSVIFGTKHILETGIAGTMVYGKTTSDYVFYPIVGYRLHGESKKIGLFCFRLFGSVLKWESFNYTVFPAGVSFGIRF